MVTGTDDEGFKIMGDVGNLLGAEVRAPQIKSHPQKVDDDRYS